MGLIGCFDVGSGKQIFKYKLRFSDEVKAQTDTINFKNSFASEKEAYNYAISRWGSGLIGTGIIIEKVII